MMIIDFFDILKDRLIIHGHGETLKCNKCGNEYVSTGKHDPGICKECQMIFSGGPLDGVKVGDLHDETRS